MQKPYTLSFTQNQLKSIIKIQSSWKALVARKRFKKSVKQIRRRNFTANQLLSSQKTYCNDLKFIIKQVLQPSKTAINDDQLHEILFSNITQIYMMHHIFLFNLESAMSTYTPHSTKISEPVLKLFTQEKFMSCYTNYCYNYPKADKIMKLLSENNSAFGLILKKSGIINSGKNLESYMIKPVQRLCKYEMILREYEKNMGRTHVDSENVRKVIGIIQSLVDTTNSQVEEFLFRQRQRQLKYEHPQIFHSLQTNKEYCGSSKRKLVYQFDKGTATLVQLIKQQQIPLQSILVFNDVIMLIPKQQKPIISRIMHLRKLQNMKYFKNLLQLIDNRKYYTFQFREDKERDFIYQAIQKRTNYLIHKLPFATVEILGTQRRDSFFKFYTVYIIQITQDQTKTKIYPRFKTLLKVQDLLIKKNLFQQLNIIPLQKQSPHLTLKSITIEKRKLHIREFLQRLINHKKIMEVEEIRQTLDYYETKEEKKKHKAQDDKRKQDEEEISILLPNWQTIKIHINCKTSKITQLKLKICEQLQFTHNSQFQIFQVRGRNYQSRRMMYDNESLLPIYETQHQLSINPFADKLQFIFTRHYYLSKDEELSLYKIDFIRLELELSVIKTQILTYGLEEELMITFMCLFAMYINMPLEDQKISSLIKEIGKKTYKLTPPEFILYYHEVQKIVSSEEDQLVTIPFLIIKILTNNKLYTSQQFQVEIHKKCFTSLQKEIPAIEQQVILAVKLENLMLLTIKEKHLIKTVSYEDIQSMEMHPNGIIFTLSNIHSLFRIKTTQGYEISKLIEIYKNRPLT